MIALSFHGAAKTVTGSKYLVRVADDSVLIDCGLFQGLKELRLRNWDSPPFDAHKIPWIVLTHCHIDHIGYLPRLFRRGFRGEILSLVSETHRWEGGLPGSYLIIGAGLNS